MASQRETDTQKDDRWHPLVRRALRQELRDGLIDTYSKRQVDGITQANVLDRLKEANKLHEKVVAPREAAIDSEHIRVLSEVARERAQSSRGELVEFVPDVYCEKLITYMGGERQQDGSCSYLDWQKLGAKAMAAFRVAPVVNFLYGSLEVVPVVTKNRRAAVAKKSISTVTEKPKELASFEEEEEEATTRGIQHVYRSLKEACRVKSEIHYFTFIVDPDSYAHTVENMFHFSFLIKEGRAGLRLGSDNQPYIFLPTDVDTAGQSRRDTKSQSIVSIDMHDWKKAIDKFNISTAAIPHNTSS